MNEPNILRGNPIDSAPRMSERKPSELVSQERTSQDRNFHATTTRVQEAQVAKEANQPRLDSRAGISSASQQPKAASRSQRPSTSKPPDVISPDPVDLHRNQLGSSVQMSDNRPSGLTFQEPKAKPGNLPIDDTQTQHAMVVTEVSSLAFSFRELLLKHRRTAQTFRFSITARLGSKTNRTSSRRPLT